MGYLILGLILLTLVFGPQLWVRHVLAKYSAPRQDFPGTGGELAEHLIEHFQLQGVGVATTPEGDHYDPRTRTVALTPMVREGRSLTAVVTAAHEVGHALQHMTNYPPLAARTRLVQTAAVAERVGSIVILLAPVIGILLHAPAAGLLTVAGALVILGIAVAVHAVTLPVEFDASFNRALPILRAGGYLPERDMVGAREILRACALTYLAASLATLLNVARWIAILRR